METTWVDVDKYCSSILYRGLRVRVSSKGDISVNKQRDKLNFLRPKNIECNFHFEDGYKIVSFPVRENKKVSHRIDELMLESFFPEEFEKTNFKDLKIDYIDGNKGNIALSNLQLIAPVSYSNYIATLSDEFKGNMESGLIFAKRIWDDNRKYYLGEFKFYEKR